MELSWTAVLFTIILGVASLAASVAIAVTMKTWKQKITQISELEERVKVLEAQLAPPEASPHSPSIPEEKHPSARDIFITAYNVLTQGTVTEETASAFFTDQGLVALTHIGTDGDKAPTLKFAPAENIDGNFWGWQDPNYTAGLLVVPNPTLPYNEEVHATSGMKETFAADYESGSYAHINVKLPAVFVQKDDAWVVDQPGIIRLTR